MKREYSRRAALNTMNETADKLIELLHSLAMYNDKGALWYRHSDKEIEAMHAKYRAPLDELIAQIGAENFPPKLLRDLRGEEVLRDGSGVFAEPVAERFAGKIPHRCKLRREYSRVSRRLKTR